MDLDKINSYRAEQQRQKEREQDQDVVKQAIDKLDKSVKHQTAKATAERKNTTFKVKNVNPVATPDDIKGVVAALDDIIVSQTVTNDDLVESFKDIAAGMLAVSDEISALPKQYPEFPKIEIPKPPKTIQVDNLQDIKPWLDNVVNAIQSIEVNPQVSVNQPDVIVPKTELDITPITKGLEKVEKALSKIDIRVPETDVSSLVKATKETTKAINSLSFPVPNYVLPFKDTDGKATQVTLGNTGGLAVQAADSPSIDAFARWRVSNPETIFDSKQIFDNAPLFWDDQEVSGSGTSSSHSTATASSTISVSATTAGKRIRQTYMRFNYQPGKSQLLFLTGVIGNQGTDIAARMGYFDDDNGIFLVNTAGTAGIGIRSSTSGSSVDNLVAQANWNLDTMDGNGASGITLDFDKAQIFVIDFEWLGVGRVRTGFVVDGKVYYCHEFLHANNIATVYMSTPNLPIRYEIEAGGTNPNTGSLEHICSSVISEGGVQDNGVVRYTSTANTQVDCAVVGTIYAIKGIRLKSAGLAATVKMLNAAVQVQSASDDLEYILIFNPTVAGTPSWTNETNSVVQTATGATANTVTGGTYITGGYVATGNAQNASGIIAQEIPNALLLGSAIDGTPDEIWLCARPLNNVNTLVEGSITWRELS